MEISALVVELESGTILDISAPRCRNRLHEIQHDPPGQVETHRGALPLDTHRGAAPQGQVDTHRGVGPWPEPTITKYYFIWWTCARLGILRDQP